MVNLTQVKNLVNTGLENNDLVVCNARYVENVSENL